MPKSINYQKILAQLIKEYPHNIDAIEKIINEDKTNNGYSTLKLSSADILLNSKWTTDEKVRLLRFLDYNKYKHSLWEKDKYGNDKCISAFIYCLKHDNVSGFEALARTYFDIERDEYGIQPTKDEEYRALLSDIIHNSKEDLKKGAQFLDIMLGNTPESELRGLFNPFYEGYSISTVSDESAIIPVIQTKELDLIKKYINNITDINPYFSCAVDTGDVEIVEYFLSLDADINYVHEYPIVSYLTPLKTAIKNSDFAMYQFLVEHGADTNLQIVETDFAGKILTSDIEIHKRARWNGPQKSNFEPEYREDVKQLKYMRESSPLEYAVKLKEKDYVYHSDSDYYTVKFEGDTNYLFANSLTVDTNTADKKSNTYVRQKIVNDLYDRLPNDKIETTNYTDLLALTFISKDEFSFNKYITEISKHQKDVDLDKLVKLFFDFKLYESNILITPFLDFCDQIKPDYNIALKLLNTYFNKVVKANIVPKFSINKFSKTLLNRLSDEDKKSVPLMPYCANLKTCKELLEYGYDINQVNDKGRTLLTNIFITFPKYGSNTIPMDLFTFVLENGDNKIKDKENKTALFYALFSFEGRNEWINADIQREHVPSINELATIELILKMQKKDINHPSIHDAINYRYDADNNLDSDSKSKDVWYECNLDSALVYRNHKALFRALSKKGYTMDRSLLEKIFIGVFNPNCKGEYNEKKFNAEEAISFVFEELDLNTNVQRETPIPTYENLTEFIKSTDFSSDDTKITELKARISKFNDIIRNLQDFREHEISKKYDENRYLEYAKEKYGIDYNRLQEYFLHTMINVTNKLGDNIPLMSELLDMCPAFDINTNIEEQIVDINSFAYDKISSGEISIENDWFYDACSPENAELYDYSVAFTGGLMQYAILTNNIELAKLLHSKGAKYEFIINDEDATWNYVSSDEMRNHIEQATDKLTYGDLKDDEAVYYLKLVNSKSEGKNKSIMEQ